MNGDNTKPSCTLSSQETEVGCYYYFMPQSPLPTLGLGRSSGASCSGNALRGVLSAYILFTSGCVPFSSMSSERKKSVVISALFGMVRQEKHLVLRKRSK